MIESVSTLNLFYPSMVNKICKVVSPFFLYFFDGSICQKGNFYFDNFFPILYPSPPFLNMFCLNRNEIRLLEINIGLSKKALYVCFITLGFHNVLQTFLIAAYKQSNKKVTRNRSEKTILTKCA